MTIESTYQPLELEKKWYQTWEESGYFAPKQATKRYCIMLPPPNITGTLHMGHAFQDTLMDALIRYHRMQGYQTLWQGGTDHAGIATQMVVERQQLQLEQVSRHDLGRDAFIEKVWQWKEHSGNTISQQMRRLGTSIDWSRERFTMDEGLSHAVNEVFVQLFDEGIIYRGKRLVNWDPKLHTAISDLEVIAEEEEGHLWHIRYPLAFDQTQFLVIATTRPETLLGDTAVAVHPNDPRYQHLIGEKIALPLTERFIPIIADDYVDPEFGTGCVKITPAHDFNDHEMGKRHGLAMINIFTDDADMNSNVPRPYQGLNRFKARERLVKDLENLGLLEKVEPHRLKIPRGDRTGEVVEPYLTDQWFANVKPMAQEAIEVVKKGKIQFIPENWSKTYFDWMENIQDWCISRQLWWGHRIPAWYDEHGNYYVARTLEEARAKYNLSPDLALTQDNDVLDTWFSSALWPFSTLGWPEKSEELKLYYPTDVLVTGFDIIFFWVARMIMLGLKFCDDVPFKKVFVTGLIQDAHGKKMSKSKGNVLDPLDLINGISADHLVAKRTQGLMQPKMADKIEKQTRKEFPQGIPSFGTDALRYTLCALASNTRHIRFDLARVESYRHFCNKIWNATRYVLMNVEGKSLGEPSTRAYQMSEQWIWSTWQQTKKTVHENFEHYRFDLIAQALYDFTWNVYCDWYLELSKPTLQDESIDDKYLQGTRYTLIAILDELMRVMHPLIPFITEEIWQKLHGLLNPNHAPSSIMLQPYPQIENSKINVDAEQNIQFIQKFIVAIRTIRSEMNIHPNQRLPLYCRANNSTQQKLVEQELNLIKKLAKLENVYWLNAQDTAPDSASSVVMEMELYIPLAGFINKEEELKRLSKEMAKLQKDIDLCSQKLSNPAFIEKAPEALVNKDREHLKICQNALEKLKLNYTKIENL